MPIWVIPILKIVLPFLIQELVKSGVMTGIEAAGIKGVGDFIIWIENLKTYQSFPNQDSKGQATFTD